MGRRRTRRTWGALALAVVTGAALAQPAGAQAPEPAEPRIVGGTPVPDIDEFPHIVNLDAGGALCGGSLITPIWVMTAAHCVTDFFGGTIDPADITAHLNTLELPPPVAPGTEVRSVGAVVVHPDYDDSTLENDIALLRLTQPSGQTPTALASAANADLWEPGDLATVAGWGTTSAIGPISEDLLWVDVPIVSDADCGASIVGFLLDPSVMLCAGDLANGGIDSCQGDSGGPLSVPGPAGGWITVGIVSFGIGCADPNSPGVYTEVIAFRPWLKSVIPGFNEAPVAFDDAFAVDEGGLLMVSFPGALANDVDPDGDLLQASSNSLPEHGTLDFLVDGAFVYQHDGSEGSADAFTYVATDGEAQSNVATVTITVNPINDPPVAADDAFTVPEGGTVELTTLLANDSDAEGDPLAATQLGDPAHGTLSVGAGGTVRYTHDGSETTADSFTYVASDGQADSNIATVSITVDPVNDAPVAVADPPLTVTRGGTLTGGGLLANDVDPDGDALTAIQASGPSSGTLSLSPDGSFTYVHDGSPGSTDSFSYRASDGEATSDPVTVDITVLPPPRVDLAGFVDQDAGLWFLADLSPTGSSLPPFFYGNPADQPFLGDWDGDGTPTPGLYRPSDGKVYLRNANSPGVADVEFFFGDPFDVPIVGDWDGDGDDTISLYRPSTARVLIQNELGAGNAGLGPADFEYTLGNPFDVPFAADFDGDGRDSVGVKRGNVFFWRNALDFGPPDNPGGLRFGDPGDQPLFGDWEGDGVATPGAYRPGGPIFARENRTPGVAHLMIFADGFESGDVAVWATTP